MASAKTLDPRGHWMARKYPDRKSDWHRGMAEMEDAKGRERAGIGPGPSSCRWLCTGPRSSRSGKGDYPLGTAGTVRPDSSKRLGQFGALLQRHWMARNQKAI